MPGSADFIKFGRLRLDVKNKVLYDGDTEVKLELKPLELFHFFLENINQTFSVDTLLDKFWNEAHVEPANVTQAIYKIRQVLGKDRSFLEGRRKIGYRLKEYRAGPSKVFPTNLDAVDRITKPGHGARDRERIARQTQLSEEEFRLYAADPLALRRVALSGEPHPVIGSAIETLIHSNLNTAKTLSTMGWDPGQVAIEDTGVEVDSAPILARLASGLLPLGREANDVKFVLTSAPPPLKDDEDNLNLWFGRTDFQTHKTVRHSPDGVEKDESLALEFGNLDVELNRVPSSAGLHYIVRLADDTVLLLRRRKETILHERGKWSISGEEQFKTHDFWDKTLLRIFQRSFCEEVVHLYDKSPEALQDRWDKYVADKIETMKLWGLLFEERACVTSLLGFYQLRLSIEEFVAWRKHLVKLCVGTTDKEGKWHWTTTSELERLLATGFCNAWLLEKPESVILEESMLHKTSRYRAFRLIRAVRGRLPSVSWSRSASQF